MSSARVFVFSEILISCAVVQLHYNISPTSSNAVPECPHRSLMEGPINKRFADAKSRAVLIEFLATELEAARMIALQEQRTPKKGEVTVSESETAGALKTLLQSVGLSRPPENVTTAQIFGKANARVRKRNRVRFVQDLTLIVGCTFFAAS